MEVKKINVKKMNILELQQVKVGKKCVHTIKMMK